MVAFFNRLASRWAGFTFSISALFEPRQTAGQILAQQTLAPPGWRWVTARNSKRKVVYERREFEPGPIRLDRGLDHILPYVQKFLETDAYFVSVGFWLTPDDHGISLFKTEGQVTVCDYFDGPLRSEGERDVRAFFGERRAAVAEDYLANSGTQRCVSWRLPGTADDIAGLIRDYLRRFYNVTDEVPMFFSLDAATERDPDESDACSFTMVYPIEDPEAVPPTHESA